MVIHVSLKPLTTYGHPNSFECPQPAILLRYVSVNVCIHINVYVCVSFVMCCCKRRLLARMDGFQELERPTLLVALTNRIDLLDSALLRPGRFEVQVYHSPQSYGSLMVSSALRTSTPDFYITAAVTMSIGAITHVVCRDSGQRRRRPLCA